MIAQGYNILALSSCVPKNNVPNSFFENLKSQRDLRVFAKTVGILNRRWASEEINTTELAYHASKLIVNKNNKKDIQAVIFVSQTPEYQIPFTSNILQHKLDLKKEVLTLDLNLGCAGFIQAIYTALSILKNLEVNDKILIVFSETLSKILDKKDSATNMLFGDGASAILINKENNLNKAYFNFFTDGSNYQAIKTVNENGSNKLKMNGKDVFDFTLREISSSIDLLLNKYQFNLNEIDLIALHQSNNFIIDQICVQLGLAKNDPRIIRGIRDFGNTSSVSIPLALNKNFENQTISKNILCSGYGSGLTWANAIINFDNCFIHKIKEI